MSCSFGVLGDGEPPSALFSARFDDVPAARAAHAGSKPMNAHSASLLGLKGSFRHVGYDLNIFRRNRGMHYSVITRFSQIDWPSADRRRGESLTFMRGRTILSA